MKDLSEIKARYFREPFDRQLGHLASNLIKVSTFLDNPKNETAVNDIIDESKFFIEWIAGAAPYNIQAFFADIQPKLALWQRHLKSMADDQRAKDQFKLSAKEWSDRLLEFSGLLS